MAYKSHNQLWESEFDIIVYKRDKLQDLIGNQLKLELPDTFKKDEKKQQILKLLMTKKL